MYKLLHKHYKEKYHGKYQHAKKLFVFDLALLLFAFVMLSSSIFFFLWKPGITDLIDLSISFGNERIKSGEEVRLTVDYANKSKFKLNNVSLALHLPNGFVINRNKTPKNVFSDDSTFTAVQEINAGASGQKEIYGWFWTEPNKEELAIANLSYQKEGGSGREQKLSSFISRIPGSILSGQLDMATSTLPNSPLKFTYTLTNSGDREIKNISIANNWNANIMNEEDISDITLGPGGTKVVEGELTTPNISGDFSFSITPRILANNHLIPQVPATKEMHIFAPQIISSARLLDNALYAEPGQILPLAIKWENKSDFKLQNITLHLAANLQNVVDWKKTAAENGAKMETNGLFFDSKARTGLSNGNPGSSDTFNVKIYLLPNFDLPDAERANLEIYPIVKGEASQAPDQQFAQEGYRFRIPLTTEVYFNTESRYYTSEGDQLGRGPIPPQVGKTTKYWIFVKILNTTNGLREAVFNTSLPEGVEFTGKQSTSIGPQLSYNNATRAISWKYDSLPANSQTGLYFEVSVTPKNSQVGQNILLTNSLQFSATDEFTNKKFEFSRESLNNSLQPDDEGQKFGSRVK